MTTDRNKLLFKHFLKYEHWQEANKLLDFQIKSPYKHYNQLNFFYFRKIIKEQIVEISTEQYFDDRIGNNAFYGLDKEFFIHQYTKPKQGMGLRKYVFLSYPMQLLFYSAGVYLVKLTSQFVLDNKKEYNLSRYGGNLKIHNANGKLIVDDNSMLYRNHYNDFKKDIKSQTKNRENKVVIRLDIQNYFDCISMSNLLDLIDRYIKTSDKNKYTYDENTISLLKFFYEFISKNALMQSDSNIIADHLGFLYLFFGDLEIERLLQELDEKYKNILKSFKIIRYVDDIYLMLEFKDVYPTNSFLPKDYYVPGCTYQPPQEYSCFISSFLHQLSDVFYQKLTLNFNSKTKILWITQDEDYKTLSDIIENVSEDLIEVVENEVDPKQKIRQLESAINNIGQKALLDIFVPNKNDALQIVFRYAFDKIVNQLLDNQEDELAIIENSFINFNFDYVRFYPQEITVLIQKIPEVRNKYKEFLLHKQPVDKNKINPFDTNLIIHYLCQSNFQDEDLIKLLGSSEIELIMQDFRKIEVINNCETGYYDAKIDFNKILITFKEVSLIEQIRLRAYAEKNQSYSMALNHLLNEIHLICWLSEENECDIKHYDAKNVRNFLETQKVTTIQCNHISNLFDRRNNNPISHAGNDVKFAELVQKDEYEEHKKNVGLIIKKISESELIQRKISANLPTAGNAQKMEAHKRVL